MDLGLDTVAVGGPFVVPPDPIGPIHQSGPSRALQDPIVAVLIPHPKGWVVSSNAPIITSLRTET